MYRNILFDFDGTVFDTVEGISKSAQYALEKQGIEASLSELRCFAGPPLVDKFMEVYGFELEQAQQATRDFKERYGVKGVRECRVFPGIKELLESLIRHGRRLGIATKSRSSPCTILISCTAKLPSKVRLTTALSLPSFINLLNFTSVIVIFMRPFLWCNACSNIFASFFEK